MAPNGTVLWCCTNQPNGTGSFKGRAVLHKQMAADARDGMNMKDVTWAVSSQAGLRKIETQACYKEEQGYPRNQRPGHGKNPATYRRLFQDGGSG